MAFEKAPQEERAFEQRKSTMTLRRLEYDLEVAKQVERTFERVGGNDEEAQEAKNERIKAEQDLRLFFAEHDPSGAMKEQLWKESITTAIQEHGFKKTIEGTYEVREQDRRRQLFLINMGELDRLNESGEHALGDRGLRLTVERVERTAQRVLRADQYRIYRVSGNDFLLEADDLSDDAARLLERQLPSTVPVDTNVDVPLSVSRTNFGKVWDRLNELGPEVREALEKQMNPTKAVVSFFERELRGPNDVAKLQRRTERLLERIKRAAVPGATRQDREEAETFYTKFQKKPLDPLLRPEGAAEPLTYAACIARLQELGALAADPTEWETFLAERIRAIVREQWEKEARTETAVEQRLSELALKQVTADAFSFEKQELWKTHGEEAGAEFPKPTRGKQALDAKRSVYEEKRKRAEASRARLDRQEADIAYREWREEWLNRDQKTGLERRGPFYQSLEQGLADGRSVGVLYVDMAFLKYFDKTGGPEVGDRAILSAANILDEVAEAAEQRVSAKHPGARVRAYRIGGDEFALSVIGAPESALEDVAKQLSAREVRNEPIPGSRRATPDYIPMPLSFNFGRRFAENRETFKRFLKEFEFPLSQEGTSEENNEIADYLVRLADREVEVYKATNRFQLLVMLAASADEIDQKRYRSLLPYSEKAIFGSVGSAKIAEWADRLRGQETNETVRGEIDADIHRFVLDVLEKKTQEQMLSLSVVQREELRAMDQLLRLTYVKRRLEELGEHRQDLTRVQEEERERLKELREKLSRRAA